MSGASIGGTATLGSGEALRVGAMRVGGAAAVGKGVGTTLDNGVNGDDAGYGACVIWGVASESEGITLGDAGTIGLNVEYGVGDAEVLLAGEDDGAEIGDAVGMGEAFEGVATSLWTGIASDAIIIKFLNTTNISDCSVGKEMN